MTQHKCLSRVASDKNAKRTPAQYQTGRTSSSSRLRVAGTATLIANRPCSSMAFASTLACLAQPQPPSLSSARTSSTAAVQRGSDTAR
eukprot:1416269-Prymnesium_polylepis.1